MATKKNRKKKKKLSSLIALLVFAIIALGTTTYAWFTSNRTVTISTLDVHVEAQNGLQISTDAATWKTVITNNDITTGYGTDKNQVPTSMEPVSTVGELDENGLMQMYYGTIKSNTDGTQILTATKTTESKGTSGKFIAFDAFLKVEAESEIEMTTSSSVVPKNELTDVGLQNAARVAFVIEGNAEVTSDTSDIRALKTTESTNVHIWEPNYDVHTSAAVAAARDTYGITTVTEGADRIEYSGVKAEISEVLETPVLLSQSNASKNPTYFNVVTPSYATVKNFESPVSVFTLQPGVTKVRVYMWIEGQDVDCENNASGTDISYNVQFSVVNKTQQN